MLSCTVLLASGSASTEGQSLAAEKEIDDRTTAVGDSQNAPDDPLTLPSPPEGERDSMTQGESRPDPLPPAAALEFFSIPPGTVFKRHVVGVGDTESNATAGVGERLIYSNTLGSFAAPLGAGRLVSDDIATIAPNGCKLRRLEFPVVGKVDPIGIGGAYTVNFALYTNCPGSVPSTIRTSLIIPGTQGQGVFPDDAPRLISFAVPDGTNVPMPTNLWLGVTFSRNNAGVIVGAPAQVGFSADSFDFPGFPCSADLGGFPDQPQASFNAEIYGDADCPEAFVGYKASKPSGSVYNPGASVFFADDIQLGVDECQMIAYEVAIKGVGLYEFEIRNNCDSPYPIAGTERTFVIGSGTDVKIARLPFDPPIAIPREFWFSAKIGNTTGGVVIAGQQASIGRTEDLLGIVGELGGCTIIDVPSLGVHAAFDLTITCAGAPPVGACCDMYFRDEADEAVCRQVPEMNCPFPPRFSALRPQWVPGEACDPDPFSPHPCGVAACCTPNGDCQNLTLNECNAVPPQDAPRQWQLGRYCNSQGQRCPRPPCLGRTGDCTLPRCRPQGGRCNLTTHTCSAGMIGQACTSNSQCHCPYNGCQVNPSCCDSCPPIGCEDVICCTAVCDFDPYCCDTEWDQTCADEARVMWCHIPQGNDDCAGARLMTDVPPSSVETDSGRATVVFDDPGFGCYLDNPGAPGLQTVWYKFVASGNLALLQTCNSNSPADDSLLAVFAVGDPSTPDTQCRSLIPIACSDDFPGCSESGKNSKACLRGLIPGNLYYVMVAAKFAEELGTAYRLDISSLCDFSTSLNDYCPNAFPITDGTTAFNLAHASMDPPVERCIPTMINDIWYNYTATCSGTLIVETCGENAAASPDTNLAIYEDCKCPPISGPPINCSADAGGNCGLGSRVVLDAVAGSCYKIRLADSADNRRSGNLKISCVPADCPAGAVTWNSPPDGVVDARRPHDPNDPSQAEGIQTITATLTPGAKPECFSLCETRVGESPNSIAGVEEKPPGTYTITLARPITAGAKTTIRYTDLHAEQTILRIVSHPGNVRGDALTSLADIADLVAALQGTFMLPFGLYSGDIDHSGAITSADVLEEVDVLNSGVWYGTPNPIDDDTCP